MLASVPSSTVWACSTSRLEVVPPCQRAVAICKLFFWTSTFWRAIASRFSRVRIEDVGIGHVAGEADQGVVIIGHRGHQAGIGGLDGPAKLAPEVEFPTGAQPDLGEPEVARVNLEPDKGLVSLRRSFCSEPTPFWLWG